MKAFGTGVVILGVTILTTWMASVHGQNSGSEAGYPILVHVHGVRNINGKVTAVLYNNNPDDFLVKGKKLDRSRVLAQEGTVVVGLEAPTLGLYAIAIYHDENANKRLDRNWVGLPTEGFGFSNNPTIFLAPPSHDEVTFQVLDRHTRIDVDLKY